MEIHWYWPFAHDYAEHPLIAAARRPGDTVTVQALSTRFGEAVTAPTTYDIVRDLPEANRGRYRESALLRAPGRAKLYLDRARARARLVRNGPFDLSVQMHLNRYVDAGALARMPRETPRVSFVHDVVPHEPRLPDRIERSLLARTYAEAGDLVVYHRSLADELCATFAIDPDRVHPIRIPLRWDPDPPPSARCGSDRPLFLFFGNFRENKGLDVLLDALPSIDDEIAVHIAGRGHGRIAERVAAAAERHRQLTCEIGFVPDDRADELLSTATAAVLPYTRVASQSGVLADAYRRRLPVVVTDVGAIGPSVRDDGTGVVVEPNDPTSLARAINDLAADPDRVATFRHAIETVGPEYDTSAVGRDLRRVFEGAANR